MPLPHPAGISSKSALGLPDAYGRRSLTHIEVEPLAVRRRRVSDPRTATWLFCTCRRMVSCKTHAVLAVVDSEKLALIRIRCTTFQYVKYYLVIFNRINRPTQKNRPISGGYPNKATAKLFIVISCDSTMTCTSNTSSNETRV